MSDSTNASDLLGALSNHMANAVERIGPALVQVNGRVRQSASGIVYSNDLVLTASHVLEREEDLTIGSADGRTLAAQLVGRDLASDLALLRVADLGLDPPSLTNEPARVGQLLLAVGRPSSNGPMASLGVVSAVGGPLRTRRGMLDRYFQTDATPYPGFSGGPLIDSQGALIGVLTTGLAMGATMGIPAATAWQVAEALSSHGSMRRGYLGISSQPVQIPPAQRGGLDREQGLLIVHVEADSPAAQGGLLVGDILVGFDGQPVVDTDDLHALLGGTRVGKTVEALLLRGGAQSAVQVTVGQRE